VSTPARGRYGTPWGKSRSRPTGGSRRAAAAHCAAKMPGFPLKSFRSHARRCQKGLEIPHFCSCPRRIATKIGLFWNCPWPTPARIAYVTGRLSRFKRPD